MEWREELLVLGQVGLAMILAAVIGLEREARHKPAGLRTHMLVAGSAALLVGLGLSMVHRFGGSSEYPLVRVDPIVVIQAIVTAVGFLGAGTILHIRASGETMAERVEGLTTAASLLFVAALGTCVALEKILLAVGVTALGWATLRLVGYLEARLLRRSVLPAAPPGQ